jgi:anti-sigma B factor antagonist
MLDSSHRRQRRSRHRPIVRRRGGRSAPRRAQPAHEHLRVTIEQHATVAVLRVSGEFDLDAVDRVERSFDQAIDALTDRVVFDLRGVSFLDLCGLRTLLRAHARAQSESFALAVIPPPGPIARIFTVTDAGRELALLDALTAHCSGCRIGVGSKFCRPSRTRSSTHARFRPGRTTSGRSGVS